MKCLTLIALIVPLVAQVSTTAPLEITGAELSWKVENEYFIIDFSPNPRTGLSGQINSVFAKVPGVLLTRGTPSSTLHLSPNLAQGGDWVCTNRWDPPQAWELQKDERVFNLKRSGPMPLVRQIQAESIYRIVAGSPAIRVKEKLEVTEDVDVSLLRVDELSIVPGENNPFTHIAWSTGTGHELKARTSPVILPLETRWLVFFSETAGFGIASICEKLSISASEDKGEVRMENPSTRFSGEPHYFYRAFIFPPENVESTGPDPLVRVTRGSVYSIEYSLLLIHGETWEKAKKELDGYIQGLSEK